MYFFMVDKVQEFVHSWHDLLFNHERTPTESTHVFLHGGRKIQLLNFYFDLIFTHEIIHTKSPMIFVIVENYEKFTLNYSFYIPWQ